MTSLRTSLVHGFRLTAVAVGLVYAHQSAMAVTPFVTGYPYDLTVNVNGTYSAATDTITGGTASPFVGFATVTDLFAKSTNGGLAQVNSLYTDIGTGASAAVIRFGYRGLPIVLVTTVGSAAITLIIPGLGFSQSFANSTISRDANVEDIKTYLKNSGGDILNRLQQLLVKQSAIDPIAGNPNSMQSRMVSDDFDRNFTQFASNIKDSGGPIESGTVNNLMGIGLSYGDRKRHV